MSLTRSGLHDVSGTLFDVVRGVEGDCLILGDEDGGTRISGPKPWGGGEVIKRFHVDEEYGPIGRLEEENAKLRELVEVLVNCGRKYHTMGGSCPMFDADAEADDFCGAVQVARELGIEVD